MYFQSPHEGGVCNTVTGVLGLVVGHPSSSSSSSSRIQSFSGIIGNLQLQRAKCCKGDLLHARLTILSFRCDLDVGGVERSCRRGCFLFKGWVKRSWQDVCSSALGSMTKKRWGAGCEWKHGQRWISQNSVRNSRKWGSSALLSIRGTLYLYSAPGNLMIVQFGSS